MVGEVYVRSVADIFDFVNVPISTKTNQQHVRTFKKTRDNLKQKSRKCFNSLPWVHLYKSQPWIALLFARVRTE
jgi:hypothetical protein